METKILKDNQIQEAASILKEGGLVAFPTETVYGLGAMATNESAVKKVYQAKGRPSDNPLIVHIDSINDLTPFVENISSTSQKLMNYFWPGPLTMIFKIKEGTLSKSVTGGLDTCAFRMPDKQMTRELIRLSGPLVGPSANTSGKPSPTTAEHVYHDVHGRIEAILDGGASSVGVESTVVDLSDESQVVILRPGKISRSDLEKVVDIPVVYDKHLVGESEIPKAPGMKYKHYAPDVPVVIVKRPEDFAQAISYYHGKHIALLASQEIINQCGKHVAGAYVLSQKRDVEAAANQLFAGLRALDDSKYDVILAEGYSSESGIGTAYMNRLQKSAGKHYFEC